MFWETAPDGSCTYLSKSWYDFTGQTAETALGSGWRNVIHPDDRARAVDEFVAASARRKPFCLDYRLRQNDGEYRWAVDSAAPRVGSRGEFLGYIGSVIDISERKHAEEVLQLAYGELERRLSERTAQLTAVKDELAAELKALTNLHDLGTRLLSTRELQPVVQEVMEATIALLHADFGIGQLYNTETKSLHIVAHRGFGQDFLEYFNQVQADTTCCGVALQRGERVIIEDVLTEPAFARHLDIVTAAGFRAMQSTPLLSRSAQPLGVISTYFRRPHRPSEHELRLADLYARQAAELIERTRAEEALRKSEERFRHMVEDVKEYAHYMMDLEGRVVTWNIGAERIKGYRAEEILGKHFSIFYEKRDVELDKPAKALASAAALGRFADEGWRVRKDGSRFWGNVIITPLKDETGKVRGFSKMTRDMTERKQAEDTLRRSEAYLAEGQKLSHTGSWAWNVSTGEFFWSQELFRIFGLDAEKESPSYPSVLDHIHPDDRARVQKTFEDAVREKRDYELPHRVIGTDGSIRHVNNIAHPVFDNTGLLVEYVGTTVDTTEREHAEKALRTSEALFRSYFELGLIGMAMTSPTKGVLEVNDELCNILGYPREELLQKNWAEMTHPDDLRADIAHFNRVMAGDIDGYTLDKRWIRKDGRMINSIMTAKCLRRADGSVDYFVGLVMDITARLRAEEKLQKTQEELARVARVITLGELAASIAHEINQPLGAIANNGNACLRLLRRRSWSELRQAIVAMVEDANRASAIIARVRSMISHSAPEKARLQLQDIVADALALAQRELAEMQVTARIELDRDLPPILGDRIQLQQLVLNLVRNGSEAMSEVRDDRRVLTITCRKSELNGKPAVSLAVQDCGCGFEAEEPERIFDAFYTTKPHGMGMGLRICLSIAEAHGGRMRASLNSNGPGATFVFQLPAIGEHKHRGDHAGS